MVIGNQKSNQMEANFGKISVISQKLDDQDLDDFDEDSDEDIVIEGNYFLKF